MTMHTTDGPADPYADPPTMQLGAVPTQPSYGHPPAAAVPGAAVPGAGAGAPGVPAMPAPPMPTVPPQPGAAQPAGVPSAGAPAKAPAPAASTGRNGMIMALGSLASRALGFVRSAMIVAALGSGPLGDSFNVGNSLPNIVYMMLIGGALASVFVPELVHAAQTHEDGGVAYTDRLLTLCGVALVVLTLGAWLAAPAVVDLYSSYDGVQRDLTIDFARYCLPQIFFYGVFTLLGQVLNSRDRFGAMMWTPVLNNVVAIGVFGLYLVIGHHATQVDQMTPGMTMLLGLGSTLGIVVQAAGLLPSLRRSGFRWRPRFDWKGTGLAKPLRSASWALVLVLFTQLAFAVITKLTTGAGKQADHAHIPLGLGNVPYTSAYQLFVVPQGVITISLVTALLPAMSRAATAGDLPKIGSDLADMLRSSAAMIVTAAVLFFTLAPQIATAAYGYGGMTAGSVWVIAQALMAFALGLPAFCAQYALARGFYAMGDARTPFWLTVVTSGTNVVLSCAAYWLLGPRWIIIGMAVAHTIACVVSVVVTGSALGRRLRRGAAPAAPAAPTAPAPDATLQLSIRDIGAQGDATLDLGARRSRPTSGLDGGRVTVLHLGIAAACAPGAIAAHWLAADFGTGMVGNLAGLVAGSLLVLVSLFLFARPLGVGASVAPLARRLRIPYPEPAPTGGRHRR